MDTIQRTVVKLALAEIALAVSECGPDEVADIITSLSDEVEDKSERAILLQGMKDAMRLVQERRDGLTVSITVRPGPTSQAHFAWDPSEPMTSNFSRMISRAVAEVLER